MAGKWRPGEFWKRVIVFVLLIVCFAVPMASSAIYCRAILWLFTAAGVVEWWFSAANCRHGPLERPAWAIPWLWAALLFWLVPTIFMLANYDAVIGHRCMIDCVFIQLVVGDSAQLLAGRILGRHHMCTRLSPGKTFEGYSVGFLVLYLYGVSLHSWPFTDLALVFVAGCIGDLYFSAVKRKLGIKDFSRVFLAHGGILDRIDSFMFAANALFLATAAGLRNGPSSS
eukprot:TRINITY_DN27239_c0_g1_i1.p1 TRINITY_DN27239_c0_g1~~TRINITY_DN27239_c0_g1_i1.p1  ORF type:complete len:227 (-),score=29.90 TRINITY_DN27239_c0_g1_i1:40-720(-)